MKLRPVPLIVTAGVLLVVMVGFGWRQVQASAPTIPTVKVERGNLELLVHADGELRTPLSMFLVAPSVGSGLQIISLAQTGTRVKSGDPVVEFDRSEQQFNLEKAGFQLQEAEQEIVKMNAESAVRAAEDKVALLRARFDVRRAELEVQRNELVSEIDARKNLLNLEEARRRLQQLEEDVKSREQSNRAALAVLLEKRNEARLAIQQAEQNMGRMVLRAPMDGFVSVKDNQDAGGVMFWGMVLPEFREGDTVQPGRNIVEIFDTAAMEVKAQIDEYDRATLEVGQPVEVSLHARPQVKLEGKVKNVAGVASRSQWGGQSLRQFDATFELQQPDQSLRTGETTNIVVRGKRAEGVLLLPRNAVFDRDGKPTVFVKTAQGFEPRETKVVHRTGGRVAVEGLAEGAEVALVDPTASTGPKATASAPPQGGMR